MIFVHAKKRILKLPNVNKYLSLVILEEVKPPEKPTTPPPPIVKQKRTTIFTIIRDFVHRHTHSEKTTFPASTTPAYEDNVHQRLPIVADVFSTKHMKNWTCDDVEIFLKKHQLDKFTKMLSRAEGNYLFRLHLMSQDSDSKLLQYMKEENSQIKLSDYLHFVQIIDGYVQQANANN